MTKIEQWALMDEVEIMLWKLPNETNIKYIFY